MTVVDEIRCPRVELSDLMDEGEREVDAQAPQSPETLLPGCVSAHMDADRTWTEKHWCCHIPLEERPHLYPALNN